MYLQGMQFHIFANKFNQEIEFLSIKLRQPRNYMSEKYWKKFLHFIHITEFQSIHQSVNSVSIINFINKAIIQLTRSFMI